jgi:hypothetical protein
MALINLTFAYCQPPTADPIFSPPLIANKLPATNKYPLSLPSLNFYSE